MASIAAEPLSCECESPQPRNFYDTPETPRPLPGPENTLAPRTRRNCPRASLRRRAVCRHLDRGQRRCGGGGGVRRGRRRLPFGFQFR